MSERTREGNLASWKRRFVDTTTPPHSSPAHDTFPSAGLPSSSACRQPRRDALRDSAGGTRLERRLPRRHGWHPWRGARQEEVSPVPFFGAFFASRHLGVWR